MNDLKETLRACLKRSGWEFDLPEDDESLRDLGLDSLGMALWIVEVERTLGMKFSPQRMAGGRFDTLAEFAQIIEDERGSK